jgi:hypothetical protein
MEMINYLDTVREARIGKRRFSSSVQADALNPFEATATGAKLADDSGQDREMLLARNFAELGLKPLFKRLLELTCKYQDKPMTIRLRGSWVDIDPSTWQTDMDMKVAVGLGTGNRDTQIAHLSQMLQIDAGIVQAQGGMGGPILTPPNVYAKLEKLQEAAGYKGANFYSDPAKAPPPGPPKPDPQAQLAQAQLQIEQQAAAHKMQLDQNKAQSDAQLQMQKAQLDAQLAREKAQHDLAISMMKTEHDIAMQKMRAAADIEINRQKAQAQAEARMLEATHKGVAAVTAAQKTLQPVPAQ